MMSTPRPISDRHAGKVAVVTGAASGIGAAIARRFVAEGGRVAGGDIDVDGLEAMHSELGDALVPVRCDVTLEADVAAIVAAAADAFGELHAGFNVAGASRPSLIVDMTEQDWDFTVDLCLKGVFLSLKHEARQLVAQGAGGAIVNIASLNSRVPMFFGAAYASAKAGVAMLGQSGALELAEHGIRVTTVSPGLTATPLVAPLTSVPEVHAAFMDRIPLKRAATAEDIAATALYLVSDDAAYVTGVNVFVDGGWEQSGYPDLRPMLASIMSSAAGGTLGS
jgi:NAD(P)-dependent dehydrogenase (short-subunit alcohol dehydrogenase family)